MMDAVASIQEVEERHSDDPAEEGMRDLGESRQFGLLLLSQGAIEVVKQHEGEFVTVVKDAWMHLQVDTSRSKRRVIDDIFEQVCERLDVEFFGVTAEQVKLLETLGDVNVDMDEVEDRVLHCSLWVLKNESGDAEACGKTKALEVTTRSGEATRVMVDPALVDLLDVGEKAVGFDLFVNSCKVKYLLGLVKMVGNADHWKDEDFWKIYGQLCDLHHDFIVSVVRRRMCKIS